MNNIIGIVGFLGSGKNTVGNFLIDQHNYRRDSFAGPLKDIVGIVFGWDRELLEGETAESREWRDQPDVWWEDRLDWANHKLNYMKRRFTPRLALQLWGTDVLRNHFFDSIWIASLEYRMIGAQNTVITDCRFPNEIKIIRELGGKVIRVRRGPEPEWWDTALAANSDFTHAPECAKALDKLGIHISEWAWIGQTFDATITNDSTLAELEEQTRWTISKI